MKQKTVALALSGGGALGSYEVGAVEALYELGYKFNIVTGSSIGALNGAFVANNQLPKARELWEGITPERVMVNGINFNMDLVENPRDGFNDVRDWVKVYLKNGFSADITPFKEFIKNAVDIDAVYNSPIKFGVTTATFPTLRKVDVDMKKVKREEFLSFLHASSACFPVFPKEKIGKTSYVDGFYNDNLPIALAFDFGATEVIAIDMRLFQLKPRNAFLIDLPNVDYIAPYISLGNMLDFSQPTIRKNMKLGYLDTMKYFKKIRGYKYAIKGKIPVGDFLSDFIFKYKADSKIILSKLTAGIRTPMDEVDYFVSAFEYVLEKLNFTNYYEAYSYKEWLKMIKEKLPKTNTDKNVPATKLNKKKDDEEIRLKRLFDDFIQFFSTKYLKLVDKNNKPLLTESIIQKGLKRNKPKNKLLLLGKK